MVSITFDEFHALRTRQRAAAEAAATASKQQSSATGASPTQPSSKARRLAMRRAAEVRSSSSGGGIGSARGGLTRTTSLSGGDSSEEDPDADADQVAPTSGSHASSGMARSARRLRGENIKDGGDKLPRMAAPIGRGEWGLSAASLGRFVELYEVQVTVVALICLDLVASMAQLLPSTQNHQSPGGGEIASAGEGVRNDASEIGAWTLLFLRMLQSFTGFTVICFGVEVAVLFAAFRRKFFNHMGYVLDLVVVALCLHHELAGMGKEVRLLGALRMWRVVRVINTLLLAADEDHNETRKTLRQEVKRTLQLEADQRRLQETLRREVEARKRIDKMLRGYKDEVETLNEALKIAAMDIAETRASTGSAAGLPYPNKNDSETTTDNNKKNVGGILATPSPAAAVKGDIIDSSGTRDSEEEKPQSSTAVSPTGRIFVFQDGTFEAR